MGKVKWVLCFLLLPLAARAQRRIDHMPVKLKVHIDKDTTDKKMISYAFDRPLVLSDFKGKADKYSPGVAATFSGIRMAFSGEEKAGSLYVDVQLLVYFDKTKSWTKREGHTPEVLAHEQIHFDITAIFACAFAQAVSAYSFTPAHVKEQLTALNETYVQNMQRTQDSYDRETAHGTLPDKQAEWAARIQAQLEEVKCYR